MSDHGGYQGNEKADKLTREGSDKAMTSTKSFCEFAKNCAGNLIKNGCKTSLGNGETTILD